MISMLMNLFFSVCASASNSNLRIEKPLQINGQTKFTVIRSGNISSETMTQMEENSPFCAIENYKLRNLKFKAGQKIKASVIKISFPNQSIQRFTITDNSNYTVFCDFTGKMNFDESKVVREINSQLAGLMKIAD